MLRAVDVIDGDRALYLQNGLVRDVLLQVLDADSLVSVRIGGSFDPARIEILEIRQGPAWEGTDFTAQVFHRTVDAENGTYEAVSGVVGSSQGLSGPGPHTVARLRLRALPEAMTASDRWAHLRLTLDPDRCGVSDTRGPVGETWTTQDMLLRLGYLGDLATGWMGADSTAPNLIARPDGWIRFEDQMVFTLGWNGAQGRQDPIADIGPTEGTVPDLHPVPDGRWDVDDIMAFTTMYSWAVEAASSHDPMSMPRDAWQAPPGRPGPVLVGRVTTGRPRDAAELGHPEQAGMLRFDLQEGSDLAGLHMILAWDPACARVESPASTGLLSGSGGELFFPARGEGILEIRLTRLDQQDPGADAAGPVLKIPFRNLGPDEPEWTCHWELYDSRGLASSWGVWRSEGDTDRGELRLLAPMPNPCRDSAVLRFRLVPGQAAALKVFGPSGRLHRRFQVQGGWGEQQIIFDGRDSMGRRLASGVYFLRLEEGARRDGRELVITR